MGQRPQDDFDERWAELVGQLGDVDTPTWPGDARTSGGTRSPGGAADHRATDGGGDDEPDDTGDEPARRGGHVVRPAGDVPGPRELSGRDWDGTDRMDAAEEAVDALEHFVPPDPGPVLGGDPLRVLTWAVAIGVPVLYVVLLLAWRHPPGWLAPVAGVLFVAAVGVLVWRMPHRRDDADDDAGAVV